jgi:ABC-type Co2+ transport system permease subunit
MSRAVSIFLTSATVLRVDPERKEGEMKSDTSLRTVEPLVAVRRHPQAAMVGGVVSAILLGGFSALVGGPVAAVLMAAVGVIIGAPGGAHLAEAAEPERPV